MGYSFWNSENVKYHFFTITPIYINSVDPFLCIFPHTSELLKTINLPRYLLQCFAIGTLTSLHFHFSVRKSPSIQNWKTKESDSPSHPLPLCSIHSFPLHSSHDRPAHTCSACIYTARGKKVTRQGATWLFFCRGDDIPASPTARYCFRVWREHSISRNWEAQRGGAPKHTQANILGEGRWICHRPAVAH